MASYDELIRALRNADAAGDADAARRIAARAQEARAQGDVAPTESLRPKARPQPGAQPPQQAPTAPQQPPGPGTAPQIDQTSPEESLLQAMTGQQAPVRPQARPTPQQPAQATPAAPPTQAPAQSAPTDPLLGELQRLMEVSPPTMQPQIQARIDEVEGQLQREAAATEAEPQQSLADLGRRFARGVTEIGASVPEAAALWGAGSPYVAGLSPQDRPDGAPRPADLTGEERREAFYADLRRAAEAEPETPMQERELFLAGEKIRQASQDLFGTPDPQFDDRFMSKLAEGAGSMAGFVGVTLLTGIGGGAAAGSALNTSGMYRRAKQEGANEEQARTAAFLGSIVGASEVVPIGRGLNMLPSKMRERVAGAIGQRMANAFATAGEEGAQEALVGISNNLIAKGVYNPEQGVFNDVGAHSDTSDQVFRRHMISHSGVSDHPEMTPSGAVW